MATKIMPVSDLRRQTSSVIKAVREESDVVYITQYGRPAVVMVDYEEYESMLERLTEADKMQPANRQHTENDAKTTLFVALAEMAVDLDVDDLAAEHDHYLYGVEKQRRDNQS